MSFIEDTNIFLNDLGQNVTFDGSTFKGLFDMPDEIVAGDLIVTTDYVLTVKTIDIKNVNTGNTITTNLNGYATNFEVRSKRMIDDGVFSQITLSKT